MGLWELFLIGTGLSMDALAVAICKGLKMRRIQYFHAAVIALFFGGFQSLMPFAGWLLGRQFESFITSFDHWIVFGLLAFVGGKMIVESVKELRNPDLQQDTAERSGDTRLDIPELCMLAVATSIDALAVGITFAFLKVDIRVAMVIIGLTTAVLSFAGVCFGNKFGAKYKTKAEIAGGVILIAIGIKILIEHLFL